jgi:hypothetical protein
VSATPYQGVPCPHCGLRCWDAEAAHACCRCHECGALTARAATGDYLSSARWCEWHAQERLSREIAEHNDRAERLARRGLAPCPEYICAGDDCTTCDGKGTVAL